MSTTHPPSYRVWGWNPAYVSAQHAPHATVGNLLVRSALVVGLANPELMKQPYWAGFHPNEGLSHSDPRWAARKAMSKTREGDEDGNAVRKDR